MLLVSAVEGVTEMAEQHFHIALTLKVPMIVMVTKIDLVEEAQLLKVREQLKSLLRSPVVSRIGLVVNNSSDVDLFTKSFDTNIVPILFASNKTGQGIDLFIRTLSRLPPHNDWSAMTHDVAEFHLTDADVVPKESPVLWGTVYKGTIKLRQRMQLGPTNEGKFV